MSSLKQFSVQAQNVFEDVLDSGHRVDYDLSASVIVSRPNKLRVDRRAGPVEQIFFYDGKTLTQYRPLDKVYATEAAPGTIEGMFDFARESLGLSMPIADLLYHNAFPLLMQDVTLAMVIGTVDIGGVRCHHLLFSRPGVDFQVWVTDAGPAVAAQVRRDRYGNPRAVEHHDGHERLERGSGGERYPVHLCAAAGDQGNRVLEDRNQRRAQPEVAAGGST